MNIFSFLRSKVVLAIAVVVGAIVLMSICNWLWNSFWPGVVTQNAYQAFGQMQWVHPVPVRLDPMAEAELNLEDENLAAVLRDKPRIHPPGTLATLEYTAIGVNDEVVDHWVVRAIVPMLGDGGGLDAGAWYPRVPDVESRLKREGGWVLRSSGATGLPADAVLRLRVGESVEMEVKDLWVTTDLITGRSNLIQKRTYSVGNETVTTPSKIRVKLIGACAADVRVGRIFVPEFASYTAVPIPIGFTKLRWVQMKGCTPMNIDEKATSQARNPAPTEESEPASKLLSIGRDGSVYMDDYVRTKDQPKWYKIDTICQFDPAKEEWRVLFQAGPADQKVDIVPRPPENGPMKRRVIKQLPPIGLYWLRWSEGVARSEVTINVLSGSTFGFVGGMLCEDIHLGPTPPGKVATCIPFADRAHARFVPDPASACVEKIL